VLQAEGLSVQSQTTSLKPFVKILLMWAGSEAEELEYSKEEEVMLSICACSFMSF